MANNSSKVTNYDMPVNTVRKGTFYPDETELQLQVQQKSLIISGKQQNYVISDVNGSRRGGGSQSIIYLCTGENDGREYAIKLYKTEAIDRKELLSVLDFLQNEKTMYMTEVSEHGDCNIEGEDYYYVVMGVYEKIVTESYIWNGEDSPEYRARIIKFVDEMNDALRFLQKHCIYHGDIKPENIMCNREDGRLVLIDFGGAAKGDQYGVSKKSSAITPRYAAPETQRNGILNKYTEYYLFGVTLAELIDGEYPGAEKEVKQLFQSTQKAGYYYMPGDLPDYYMNLLRGLLCENLEYEEMQKYRWDSVKVDTWLEYMRLGKFEEAASCNPVVAEIRSESHIVQRNEENKQRINRSKTETPGNEIVKGKVKEQVAENPWEFGKKVFFEHIYDDASNLTQMADIFLKHWHEGIEELLSGKSFSGIKPRTWDVIKDARERLNVKPETGQSINAEFFKFVFDYASDKTDFIWKDKKEIKTVEGFAMQLMVTLDEVCESGGFGNWVANMQDAHPSWATEYAEIFRNRVYSYYLRQNRFVDKNVLEQCRRIENMFQNTGVSHTNEDLAQMYIFARMLLNDKGYETESGLYFEDYADFIEQVNVMAYDVNRATDFAKLMNDVQDADGGFKPAFEAFRRMENL